MVTRVTYVVGITVRTTAACPHMRGAILDTTSGLLVRTFQHRANAGQDVDQLHEIAQDLESELAAQAVSALVIWEAGFNRAAGLTAPVKNRLRAEGVCVAVARDVIETVAVLDVNALAHALGRPSKTVVDAGEALTQGVFGEAATAALAAATL